MAIQVINVGSSANSGGGDPLRSAMIKINDNFAELYARTGGEAAQTIIGADSTVLVDGPNSSLNAAALSGDFPNDLIAFSDLANPPDTIAGFGITDAYTKTQVYTKPEVDDLFLQSNDLKGTLVGDDSTILVDGVNSTINAGALVGALPAIDGSALTGITATANNLVGDMKGSVFADDSTLLVDGVNGTIPAANLTGALPAIDGSALTGVTVSSIAFSNVTGTPTTLAGYGITDAVTSGGDFEGNLSGSVFADDSTLLVDGVNGTLNSSALTKPIALADDEKITFGTDDDLEIFHNSSNGNTIIENNTGNLVIKGSNLFLQSATSEYFFRGAANGAVTLYYDNVEKFATSADGISVTDHIALADNGELRLGTDNDMQISHSGTNGLVKSVTGTLVLQGPTVRIQDSGSSQTAFSAADGIATLYHTNTAVLNTTAGGIQIEQGVEEKFATLTGSTGVVTHDCDTGHVFYHTGAAGDITANFTNLGLTAEYGTNLTVIINQGATPYEVTAVQIGGVAQTINWQGGTPPTGNASGIDSFSFTILNDGGTYVVLGQMVDFT